MLFGLAVKQLLDEKKLSQRQFAKQAGLEPAYVSKLVNGRITEPRQETCCKIANGLGIAQQDLLEQIAQYSNPEAGETVFNPTGSGKREEAIAKPSQESVETYAGSGKNLMSLATSMLEQLSFDEKFKKNITSSYTGYRLKNPGARAKKYLLVLAQRKEGLCISVSKDVLEPHILCLEYYSYEDETPDIILGKFWIIPSKEDIFLASMQTHYPTLLDGEVTGSFTLNERTLRFFHCSDIDNSIGIDFIDFIDDSIDFIESPEEFEVNSLGSHNCYLVINEDQLFPDTLQVCITSREILEEFIRYFGEILMEN
ncbi:MAG: helix-turn-helix transcriptional regulator [Coleofasciculus chthonoplastes F3-SA18-01]